jgi:hypothetical protein
MADRDFKVKSGLDLGTPLPLTEGGTGQTSASNALNVLLPVQTDNASKVLQTNGTSTSWVTLPNGYSKGDTASRPGSPSLGDIYSNTQTGYIEVYTSAGWSQLGVIPESVTISTPTDVGTNVAYGSGSVDVAFTPSSGGGLASSFTAISSPGLISASGSSSPVRVTGLTQGTSYTFTVTATNGYGNALASSSSSSVTPTSLPQAPTIGTATATNGISYGSTPTASLTFTAGATGGKTISNYKYSIDGSTYTSLSPEDTTSPVTIPGLISGQSYTVRLKAVNNNGDSVASSASNSITVGTVPQAPTIGTPSVTNTTTVSIPFTEGNSGGSTITSYTVASSPSISLTTSGTTSPLTVTGSFADGVSYTFTVAATNSFGTSLYSSSSTAVTPSPTYTLLTTATSTQNYTWPSGYSKLRAVVVGGGGGGAGGSGGGNVSTNQIYGGQGGGGGGGGGVVHFSDYSVSPGTTLAITVAGSGSGGNGGSGGGNGNAGNSGGVTNLTIAGTSIATANGGSSGSGTNASNSASAGTGGAGGNGSNNISATNVSGPSGGTGGAGANASTITYNAAGILSLQTGGGGGGGGQGGTNGWGDFHDRGKSNGGAGGSSGGGKGGDGNQFGNGQASNAGTTSGAGGGGGAGGATQDAGSSKFSGSAGSSGASGVIYIYGR